ncbi:hypothetical protein CVT24_009504 [Panaeolus cyanescens]|uniref:Coenzyme Q-binding protein COQ10 START domain-containing protein n=1 Tax=Panaeolus cyanescens TaxID=181874 RepID=A0A409VAH8_9AGAR|nr:hypothetical protein CVT24_009504 [Panaeolus cyanescens]
MLLCSSLRTLRTQSAPLSRTLFSLPNLPSFSTFGSAPQTFKQEKRFSNPTSSSSSSSSSVTTKTLPNTLVSFDLTYEFANPLHAGVSSAFFGQVANMMVQAFEDRCADVYGLRPPPPGS